MLTARKTLEGCQRLPAISLLDANVDKILLAPYVLIIEVFLICEGVYRGVRWCDCHGRKDGSAAVAEWRMKRGVWQLTG